jgi:hypothetical protein
MSLRSKVRRHRDTKRQLGLPNLLLAVLVSTTSAYSKLGVLQGFEPPTSATNSISLPLSHISYYLIIVANKVKEAGKTSMAGAPSFEVAIATNKADVANKANEANEAYEIDEANELDEANDAEAIDEA